MILIVSLITVSGIKNKKTLTKWSKFLIQILIYLLYFWPGITNPRLRIQYNKSNQSIQKWIKILRIVSLVMTPMLIVLPVAILSYVTYFTTDLGGGSFELPTPMW